MSLLLVLGWAVGISNEALRSVYKDRAVSICQIADINRLTLRSLLSVYITLDAPTPEGIAKSASAIKANLAKVSINRSVPCTSITLQRLGDPISMSALAKSRAMQSPHWTCGHLDLQHSPYSTQYANL